MSKEQPFSSASFGVTSFQRVTAFSFASTAFASKTLKLICSTTESSVIVSFVGEEKVVKSAKSDGNFEEVSSREL